MFNFLAGPGGLFAGGQGASAAGLDPRIAEALSASMDRASQRIDTAGQRIGEVVSDPSKVMNEQWDAFVKRSTGRAPMNQYTPVKQVPLMPEPSQMSAPQVVAPQPRRAGAQAQMPSYFRRPMIPGLLDR